MAGMIEVKVGKVVEIISRHRGLSEIEVLVKERQEKAFNYDGLTGEVQVMDRVLLNTTALSLGLGTGGYHFVQSNLTRPELELTGPGHIMKLRYAPGQLKVLSVEEEAAGNQDIFNNFSSLKGFVVMIIPLHSALVPLVVSYQAVNPGSRLVYIMTDGGALPVPVSQTVEYLRNVGLISGVVSSGNCFGGDWEAINIYSALITAKEIAGADAAVIGMGPGHAGTGTKWGFSGIQLGEVINAVNVLGGRPVFCPRVSFADQRNRHRGISHHSLTVLTCTALAPALVVLPFLQANKISYLKEQVKNCRLEEKHTIAWEYGNQGLAKMEEMGLNVTTMGRNLEKDADYFLAACAAGIYGGKVSMQVGIN